MKIFKIFLIVIYALVVTGGFQTYPYDYKENWAVFFIGIIDIVLFPAVILLLIYWTVSKIRKFIHKKTMRF